MKPRLFKNFDWSLRSCGKHGHITYAPTEPELRARLHTTTVAGEAWRCLRCGLYVVGTPHGEGPADEAPIVLRGAALKDAFILRLLAAERGIRGLAIVAIAYGIWRFDGSKDAIRDRINELLPTLKPFTNELGVNLENFGPVEMFHKLLYTNHNTLVLASIAVLAYGLLNLTEATGLWMMKRWGEYVAVIGTSAFIPLEIYELIERQTLLRVGALIINTAAVAYLLWTKRLFGIRGGHEAFVAERHSASLLEVEQAAIAVPAGQPASR